MNLARDVMTVDVVLAEASLTVGDVMELMQKEAISHVPIVDAGVLVGIVSSRDLNEIFNPRWWNAEREAYFDQLMKEPISEMMTSPPHALAPDTPLTTVIDEMVDAHIGAMVIDDPMDGVVGIISYVDLLRALRYAAL